MATPEQGRLERRLAAILAADVAGCAGLMAADEIDTARALREHRAAIDPVAASRGGRITRPLATAPSWSFPPSWQR